MFERFTDRARRVVVLAQEEARGLNHNYIGTEHLLLGLLHDTEGVAGMALARCGVSLESARRWIEEMIGIGVVSPGGHIPFTPRNRRVLELALREALHLRHSYIGTEHLLLGLIRDGEDVGVQVIARHGVDLRRLRLEVIELLDERESGTGEQRSTPAQQPPAAERTPGAPPRSVTTGGVFERFTDRARRVIVLAQEEARMRNHDYIGTEHLLLGVIGEREGLGATAIVRQNVALESLRMHIEEIIGRGQSQVSGHIPFTPRSKKVLELSLRESLELGDTYIGTQHILAGLISEGEGVAALLLTRFGVTRDATRSAASQLLDEAETGARETIPSPRSFRSGHFERYTAGARRVIVLAQEEARLLHHTHIGVEHLLLGLLHEGQGVGARSLISLGVTLENFRLQIDEVTDRGPTEPTGHIPFHSGTKDALFAAEDEVQQLGVEHIDTEHLLLGVTHVGDDIALPALLRLGVDYQRIRRQVMQTLAQNQGIAPAEPAETAATCGDAVEKWARRQAGSVARGPDQFADIFAVVSGLVLLGQSGVYLPLGFVADVVRLTHCASRPDERLAAVHALPDIRRLRELNWPPAARVGFAALLGADAPPDPGDVPPPVSAAELRSSLIRAISLPESDLEPVLPDTGVILNAGRRVTDGTVTGLLVVGPGSVAVDPALPLRMRQDSVALPALTGPQRSLLEWSGARPAVEARSRSGSTARGPGMTGVSRRGQLTNLLPSQLALPPELLVHRFAERSLLYRLHETQTEPPLGSVRIVLDTSPPTFGSVGVVLRIVVHAVVSTLWSARQVPTLVFLDQPAVEITVHKPSDLGNAWAHYSLDPADVSAALASCQRADRPSVLLTQHHLVADHAITGTPWLRLITAQLPGDAPANPAVRPFHTHLSDQPSETELAAAVCTALALETR
ncbi:ClpA/ClpB-like protein [Micromonospora violae]|uniref:ClpA/ClpB-like protein n=1 Tax=Micromonospora violae TaxID=1278207 RepID=A0A4Q7UJ70_9ACTN|nr:Clp protease N-terminal domain-containing protein [Micromonospora violae]RZT79593.1 ClpA/ClpB-like protein [Micromonospora violae]